jgi:hypothetical protein
MVTHGIFSLALTQKELKDPAVSPDSGALPIWRKR